MILWEQSPESAELHRTAQLVQFSLENSQPCICPRKGGEGQFSIFFFFCFPQTDFKLFLEVFSFAYLLYVAIEPIKKLFSSTELLLDGGFMLPLRHLITNLISGIYIFSFYFVLLRTALPLYVTYTVCRYHCNYLGSLVVKQFSQNQNTVHDCFAQLSYKSHQSFVHLLQGYVIKD